MDARKVITKRADINKVPLIFSDDLGLPHRSQIRKTYDTILRQAKLKQRGFILLDIHTQQIYLMQILIY